MRFVWMVALAAALAANAAAALDRVAVERQFRVWLDEAIWPEAGAEGVSRAVFDAAFNGVNLDWSLPGLVPPGTRPEIPKERKQSEFGPPADYFRESVMTELADNGRRVASRNAGTLARVARDTGVPGHIVVAIWGRESSYGNAAIPHDVFRVLGTKSFMGSRAAYFRGELVAALKIAEAGHASDRALKSSWAGALGQPQFMPTSFLAYAADGDGDMRADIWDSEADVIASIANYLMENGWVSGRDWGFEVRVPESVSCALEGPERARPIREWADMGVTRVSGRPFPDHEVDGEGVLLMPAGRFGPAFVLTPNFSALKAYNRSELYALFIGNLADRVAHDMGDFIGEWGSVDGLHRSDVARMQRALEYMGYDVGGADGFVGFRTRRAIGNWQESLGLRATCFPEAAMKKKLAPPKPPVPRP